MPSLAIGVGAFFAGELLFSKEKSVDYKDDYDLKKVLEQAKKQNKHLLEMRPLIEDEVIRTYLTEIHDSTAKIIRTVEKSPNKFKSIDNFFDYYLPITVKIVDRYDEIENQKLSSKDSKKFFTSSIKMLDAVNKAFKNILNSLYQSEIIDMDAEMKVFSSMLTSDGFNNSELDIKDKED